MIRAGIEICLSRQELRLVGGDQTLSIPVSTARNGAGAKMHSECTPLGEHVIRAKIGGGEPVNTVFVGRRPSGEFYSRELAASHPGRDWILTRILWLSGLEPGRNRLGNVDTMQRYIYIHGAPDQVPMGITGSHGCIRMRNADVIYLFDKVAVGARVSITE